MLKFFRPSELANKFLLLVCATIVIADMSLGQERLEPSIYIGTGMGTNLGGTVGAGAEVLFDSSISLSAAVGKWRDIYGYDAGFKYYPMRKGLYLGINYGVIEESMWTEYPFGQAVSHVEKIYGLSFTAGYRLAVSRSFYLSGYIGITNNEEANNFRIFESSTFVPRIGVMLGYVLKDE